jgi:hypothetical protein
MTANENLTECRAVRVLTPELRKVDVARLNVRPGNKEDGGLALLDRYTAAREKFHPTQTARIMANLYDTRTSTYVRRH